ncbi:MAG TPA: hypothetical protein VMX75_09920 [Spirochaetia bacterium]|nr:hypothetical protein [Spirochaetia bacterium]
MPCEDDFTESQKEKVYKVFNTIAAKAATDQKFRKLCLSDPRAAFKQLIGVDFPKDAKLKFVEPGSGVPDALELPSIKSELTDDDLERVAGGAYKPGSNIFGGDVWIMGYALPIEWDKIANKSWLFKKR